MTPLGSSTIFSRPLHGLHLGPLPIPAMNRWAIFNRPLTRTQAAAPVIRYCFERTLALSCGSGFLILQRQFTEHFHEVIYVDRFGDVRKKAFAGGALHIRGPSKPCASQHRHVLISG